MSDLELSHIVSYSLRLETNPFHVLAELIWDFLENLFSKISSLHCFIELNKLDNITSNSPAPIVSQFATVTVKFFHRTEISIANANYDN